MRGSLLPGQRGSQTIENPTQEADKEASIVGGLSMRKIINPKAFPTKIALKVSQHFQMNQANFLVVPVLANEMRDKAVLTF